MRPIDADALVKWLDVGHLRHPSELCYSELNVANIINHAPTIDAAPVRRGEWKHFEYPFDKMTWITGEFGCAECGGRVVRRTGDKAPNFCPNCGADMRRGDAREQ